jgi:DNA-directed RNA polymerase subunit beta
MSDLLANNFRYRRSFAKTLPAVDVDNLIQIQRDSYEKFLQMKIPRTEREGIGLQGVFKSVFPIQDFSHRASLQFVAYDLEIPKYDVDECRERGMTFSAPLKVTVRLVVWDVDQENDTRTVSNIKEQEVYFGEIPLMTENGTFVINGTERVIVSQLHRSPGIFFDAGKSKTGGSGKTIFSARIIPNRGSWIDFEFDTKDILYVRIDRRRKLPATVLLRALGYSSEELLNYFYQREKFIFDAGEWKKETTEDLLKIQQASVDIYDSEGGLICKQGRKFLKPAIRKMQKAGMLSSVEREVEGRMQEVLVGTIPVASDSIFNRVSAYDVVDMETGEVLVECNEELSAAALQRCMDKGVFEFETLYIDNIIVGSFLRDTLLVDKISSTEEAVIEIYRRLRPGEPPTYDAALNHFENLFFNAERYDLSKVGRLKVNHKLGLNLPLEQTTLTREDILRVVQYLIDLKNNKGQVDDIDHLGNRRVRAVGELLENQYRIGLVRMEKAIKERMSLSEIEALMPHDLINAKPVSAVIKEFFGSSQLSQFMDQTNPLSEVTHKRRLSALGPGGLTRERAGFEVRDVHPTHYGRICPIERPEGPNIGLINSLATHARVNKYGFIESPYLKVTDGRPSRELIYLSAMQETGHKIAQANAALDENGALVDELVQARENGEATLIPRDEIDLIDVSPKQVVSVAAALIPFLENDDANRALMGSNMQRQAVPLLQADAPLVGTGMEGVVARDSGAAVAARRIGVVEQVDSQRIVVRATEERDTTKPGVDIYRLLKFQRSNQNTCITQRPIVKVGDIVTTGDIIADGPSTELGELALGRNVLVAFMPWNGYNFEDSILISERIVKDDVFTSIHIEEFEVAARDTKLGPEEITRDIPNVGEEALRNLDEAGIVAIGAEVFAGDILVGKVTPKGESPMTPEEKLLRAIFGEKASDVRDTSLRLPPGVQGTIVEVRVFNRHGVEKDQRAMQIERQEIERLAKDRDDELTILERNIFGRLKEIMRGKSAVSGPKGFKKGLVSDDTFEGLTRAQLWQIGLDDDSANVEIEGLKKQYDDAKKRLDDRFNDKVDKLQRGDELPPGVMKIVKVFVAVKRKLQPGDKMAGRHGNKGVISKIVPVEDMPFLEDGTHVDIVLNPLGVPSRMNVGQILETHLGWACANLGKQVTRALEIYQRDGDNTELKARLKSVYGDDAELPESAADLAELATNLHKGVPIATPVFDGAKDADIRSMLRQAGLSENGQVQLYDGLTGEPFTRPVTVGYIYMLKLHHLVDDKIHARSTGPYSLVTQQPLGGKAQFGGQRFGEMEVWALEAYGAAYTLQEMLTVKSDDVAGRTKVYEAIVRGDDTFEAGIPESFNVLVKEMRSLGLNVELTDGRAAKQAAE